MIKLKFDTRGVILNSRNPQEKFIKIIDDKENTGGFIIFLSGNGNFLFPDSYDDWVEDLAALKQYLQETAWIIDWS